MGALMRSRDWTSTSIGAPSSWPQSLRTVIRILLNTRHPMYVFWGPELLCFYNDSYRQSIGDERHPQSLGMPGEPVWREIWPTIGPQIEQVLAGGGATLHENQLVPITRNGVKEDVYWTYSFSPIGEDDAPGGIGGVIVVCNETTEQVRTAADLRESERQLEIAMSAGRGVGTWDWDIPNDRVFASASFARLYGVSELLLAVVGCRAGRRQALFDIARHYRAAQERGRPRKSRRGAEAIAEDGGCGPTDRRPRA